jgi:hypothetical protein
MPSRIPHDNISVFFELAFIILCISMAGWTSFLKSLAAQWFALLALGRARTLLRSRKNLKPEECLKTAMNPRRPVHALLGAG